MESELLGVENQLKPGELMEVELDPLLFLLEKFQWRLYDLRNDYLFLLRRMQHNAPPSPSFTSRLKALFMKHGKLVAECSAMQKTQESLASFHDKINKIEKELDQIEAQVSN